MVNWYQIGLQNFSAFGIVFYKLSLLLFRYLFKWINLGFLIFEIQLKNKLLFLKY